MLSVEELIAKMSSPTGDTKQRNSSSFYEEFRKKGKVSYDFNAVELSSMLEALQRLGHLEKIIESTSSEVPSLEQLIALLTAVEEVKLYRNDAQARMAIQLEIPDYILQGVTGGYIPKDGKFLESLLCLLTDLRTIRDKFRQQTAQGKDQAYERASRYSSYFRDAGSSDFESAWESFGSRRAWQSEFDTRGASEYFREKFEEARRAHERARQQGWGGTTGPGNSSWADPPSDPPSGAGRKWYEILGVPAGADRSTIKSAWRRLAKKFHPDKYSGNPEYSRRMQEINDAKKEGLAGL